MKRLQEQFQKERELRAAMEAGLNMSSGRLPISSNIDKKVWHRLGKFFMLNWSCSFHNIDIL